MAARSKRAVARQLAEAQANAVAGASAIECGFSLEMLKTFCATHPDKANLAAPFSLGDFSFATDGAILVRVNRMEGCPENPAAPNPTRIIKWVFPFGEAEWKRAPAVDGAEAGEGRAVKFGRQFYAAKYVRLVVGLPGAEVRLVNMGFNECLAFRFGGFPAGGGIGLLMALKSEGSE